MYWHGHQTAIGWPLGWPLLNMGSNIATGGSLVWCSTFISTGCAVSKGKLFFLKLIYKIIFSVMNIPQKKMYIILLLSTSVVSDSVRPHRWQPTRLPRPWDPPGKNTGAGCHFLLQCMKVKSESEVVQSRLTQRSHGLQPTRLLHPWDFPGKSTGVGCHCLLLYIILYSCNFQDTCTCSINFIHYISNQIV